MKKIIQKIVLITIMLLITLIWNSSNLIVYATSEAEELKQMLDLYKTEMGDLKQLKAVIDEMYNTLDSANKVDETLKSKLLNSLNKLYKIDGMNPVIAQALVVTIEEQINGLNNDTLPEIKEEVGVMKEWADAQQPTNPEPTPQQPTPTPTPTPDKEITPTPTPTPDKKPTLTPTPTPTITSKPSDNSTVGKDIPKAGLTHMILVIAVGMTIVAIFANKKYKNLDNI